MINKNYLKKIRSRDKYIIKNFIYEKIAKTLIDSLDLITVKFDNILELGINDYSIYKFLHKKNPLCNYLHNDISKNRIRISYEKKFLEFDLDNWKLNKNCYDLIFSNMYIHLFDDIENILRKIQASLKKNGFLIFAIPDKNNIQQLLNSLIQTDLDLYQGVFRRINPTLEIDDMLLILKKLNFDIPTINTDKITIEYNKFDKLLNDIRSMCLTYCHKDKKSNFEKKNYFIKLEQNFKRKNYLNDSYILDLQINYISAWKK